MGSIDDASPSRFEWHRSKQHDGWVRDIDECEEFYRSSAKKEAGCFPVTGCASLVVDDSNAETRNTVEEALKTAWANLRHSHPTLGSRLVLDPKSNKWIRVFVPFTDSEEEDRWLDATFKVIDCDGDALEWFNDSPPSFETSTLFLVRPRGGKTSEVVLQQTVFLRCPHDVTDGIGVLLLVDQLLEHAALALIPDDASLPSTQRHWDGEHSRLSPCLRIAAGVPDKLPEAIDQRLGEIQAQNGTIYNHPALLSLPPSNNIASSPDTGRTLRVSRVIEQSVACQLFAKCKTVAPGVSITHVFMAALAMALAQVQPKKKKAHPARYVNHSMINLRPFCSPPYNSSGHAAAPYHTISAQAVGIDVTVGDSGTSSKDENVRRDLTCLATQVRDFYSLVRPVASEAVHEQICFAPSTFQSFTAQTGSDPHAVSNPPFCPVALSSIGNISSFMAPKYGVLKVRNVWAASEPLGAGVALFLGTWNGELELSGVFDSRFHDTSYVEDFLDTIIRNVCKGLEVDTPPMKNAVSGRKRSHGDEELDNERPVRRTLSSALGCI